MGSFFSKAKKEAIEVKNAALQKYEEVKQDQYVAMLISKMQQIDSWKFITIEQKLQWSQCLKCCDPNNKFALYVSKDNNHMMPLGNFGLKQEGDFEEFSDFCCRQFIRGAREFTGNLRINGEVITQLDVPYKCHTAIPCCSCPCSEAQALIYNSNHKQILGQLIQPYYICWCRSVEPCPLIEIEVREVGANGVPILPPLYIITGNCCQASTICLPFMAFGSSCNMINYRIIDGRNPDYMAALEQPLGLIKNICRDCPEECLTKADRFGIDFPVNATPQQKLLLINAAIWLNYLQYEFL